MATIEGNIAGRVNIIIGTTFIRLPRIIYNTKTAIKIVYLLAQMPTIN